MELINATLRRFYQPLGTKNDYERLKLVAGQTDLPESLATLHDLHQFAFLFRGIVFEEGQRNVFVDAPRYRMISQEDQRLLSRILDQRISQLVHKVWAPTSEDLARAALSLVQTVILFAAGRAQEALQILRETVLILEANTHLWPFASPRLPDLIHMNFLMTLSLGDHSLSATLNRFQHQLLDYFPSTEIDFLSDESLLVSAYPHYYSSLPIAKEISDFLAENWLNEEAPSGHMVSPY